MVTYYVSFNTILCTDSYSDDEVLLLVTVLKNNFNLNCIIRNRSDHFMAFEDMKSPKGIENVFL
jgi:hypothetical protein